MSSNKLDLLLAKLARDKGLPLSSLQEDLLEKRDKQVRDDYGAFDAHLHISFEEAVQHRNSAEIRARYQDHLPECSFCQEKLNLVKP
jgi:hypothetical protein